jgi:hypothetical protein
MMRAMTMQPSRDVPLLYPACPSCGRALRFARTVPGRTVSQNSRHSAAANAASGSRNQPTSIPRGISPRAHSGYLQWASSQLPYPERFPPRLGSSFVCSF